MSCVVQMKWWKLPDEAVPCCRTTSGLPLAFMSVKAGNPLVKRVDPMSLPLRQEGVTGPPGRLLMLPLFTLKGPDWPEVYVKVLTRVARLVRAVGYYGVAHGVVRTYLGRYTVSPPEFLLELALVYGPETLKCTAQPGHANCFQLPPCKWTADYMRCPLPRKLDVTRYDPRLDREALTDMVSVMEVHGS